MYRRCCRRRAEELVVMLLQGCQLGRRLRVLLALVEQAHLGRLVLLPAPVVQTLHLGVLLLGPVQVPLGALSLLVRHLEVMSGLGMRPVRLLQLPPGLAVLDHDAREQAAGLRVSESLPMEQLERGVAVARMHRNLPPHRIRLFLLRLLQS